MRTDYKIGIAALVLVGVVITVWSLVSNPEPIPEPDDPPQDVARADRERGEIVPPRDDRNSSFYGTARDDDVAIGIGGAIVGQPRDDAAGAGGAGTSDVDDAAARADALAALRAAMQRSRARDAATDGGLPRGAGGLGALGHDRGAGVARVDPARPAGTTKYVVKSGDAGFWTVSERAYGDGKHWALIAKANPDADSNALREGQILKIPPLPVADASAGRGAVVAGGATAGQFVSQPDGTRHYTVQEGDAGFWTVSQKAYGNGKHWALIAKANPGADSGSLKKGQKLLVPPLPAGGSGGASSGRTALARTLGPGEKWYTIVEGDAGFWDVAKKSYGAGKHWAVIEKANPNVNPGRLRAGQKILVPPLPDSPSRSTARTSTPRDASTSSRYDDDQPIFE